MIYYVLNIHDIVVAVVCDLITKFFLVLLILTLTLTLTELIPPTHLLPTGLVRLRAVIVRTPLLILSWLGPIPEAIYTNNPRAYIEHLVSPSGEYQ